MGRREEHALKQLLRITILLIGLIWILAWAAAGRFDDTPNTQDGSESPLPSGEIAAPGERDSAKTLRVQIQGEVQKMDMGTYLLGVLRAEMPASFAPEALKAQAVAARTFACRQTAGGKHENADVCAQSACCQACLTVEDLRARYGDGFEAAWDKALAAVRETQNEVLTYEGALIDAVYFSCSGGSTEDAAAVWGTDVPYLRAVESPGEQDAAKYESRVCVTAETFAETLRALDASAQLSGDPSGWVQSVTRTPGGGVDTLTAGDRSFSGAIYGGGKDGAKVNGGTTVELVEGQMNFSGTISTASATATASA